MTEETFWNGEPCEARKVTVVVADSGSFPSYWARSLVGRRVDAVEVVYHASGPIYLIDEEVGGYNKGEGWHKVTDGHGSPRWRHGSLEVEPGSVEAR